MIYVRVCFAYVTLLPLDQIGTSVFSILQWASLVAQSVKNLPAVQETRV